MIEGMVDLVKEISELGLGTTMLGFFLALSAIVGIKAGIKKFKDIFGLVDAKELEHRELLGRVSTLEEKIKEVDKRVTDTSTAYDSKLEEFHQQSIDIRGNIFDVLNGFGDKFDTLTTNINNIATNVHDMQDKNDASDRARIKDRIAQSYRFYHEKKQWTHMEKEAFEDLIASYEAAGGTNSFVHSICEPECQTWIIVDED